jgi:hypothetical protein
MIREDYSKGAPTLAKRPDMRPGRFASAAGRRSETFGEVIELRSPAVLKPRTEGTGPPQWIGDKLGVKGHGLSPIAVDSEIARTSCAD